MASVWTKSKTVPKRVSDGSADAATGQFALHRLPSKFRYEYSVARLATSAKSSEGGWAGFGSQAKNRHLNGRRILGGNQGALNDRFGSSLPTYDQPITCVVGVEVDQLVVSALPFSRIEIVPQPLKTFISALDRPE